MDDRQSSSPILRLHPDILKYIFRDVCRERTIMRWVCRRFRDVFSGTGDTRPWFPYHACGFTYSCLESGYLDLYDWAISNGAPTIRVQDCVRAFNANMIVRVPEHAVWHIIGGKDGMQRALYRAHLFCSDLSSSYTSIVGKFAAACGYISILEELWKRDDSEWSICEYGMYVVACENECVASFVWFYKKRGMRYANRPYKHHYPPFQEDSRLRTALYSWSLRLGFESKNKNEEGRCTTTEGWLMRQFSEPETPSEKRAAPPSWMLDPPAKRVTRSMTPKKRNR